MTAPTNWPDPNRPGVPMFPERDGWHLVTFGARSHSGTDFVIYNACWWETAFKRWRFKPTGRVLDLDDEGSEGVQYIGPVLTPTQINEMLAAERERCAKQAQEISDGYYDQRETAETDAERIYADERMCAASECSQAIRNLGAAS